MITLRAFHSIRFSPLGPRGIGCLAGYIIIVGSAGRKHCRLSKMLRSVDSKSVRDPKVASVISSSVKWRAASLWSKSLTRFSLPDTIPASPDTMAS